MNDDKMVKKYFENLDFKVYDCYDISIDNDTLNELKIFIYF